MIHVFSCSSRVSQAYFALGSLSANGCLDASQAISGLEFEGITDHSLWSLMILNLFFYCCYQINPICNSQLYFLIHPYFVKPENIELFKSYENTKNLNVFYLKDKGWKDDWKAGNLNFDEFFLHF